MIYRLATGTTLAEVTTEVEMCLREGWVCQGGIALCTTVLPGQPLPPPEDPSPPRGRRPGFVPVHYAAPTVLTFYVQALIQT